MSVSQLPLKAVVSNPRIETPNVSNSKAPSLVGPKNLEKKVALNGEDVRKIVNYNRAPGSVVNSTAVAKKNSKTESEKRYVIHDGRQGKHVPAHKNFQSGKSEITDENPEALLKRGSGKGQQIGTIPVGQAGSKERVDFGGKIGDYVDPVTGEKSPTSIGIIHYSSQGAHIVPARPK